MSERRRDPRARRPYAALVDLLDAHPQLSIQGHEVTTATSGPVFGSGRRNAANLLSIFCPLMLL
jgi:hypothetical protein